jgi:hypothetical protein
VPARHWLHHRGALAALSWNTQRLVGRRWYAKNVRGRPPLVLDESQRGEPSPAAQPGAHGMPG